MGVEPATIYSWMRRGYLRPARRRMKPIRFRESDLLECALARRPPAWHEELDILAAKWEAVCNQSEERA